MKAKPPTPCVAPQNRKARDVIAQHLRNVASGRFEAVSRVI